MDHRGSFLQTQIPSASVVVQMTVRRVPLPEFAERDAASTAFADLWSEVRVRLEQQPRHGSEPPAAVRPSLNEIESLAAQLESALERELRGTPQAPIAVDAVVHTFDTDDRDLVKSGYVLELRESAESLVVVAGRVNANDATRVRVQVDGAWALQILAEEVSPVVILDRRLGRPGPPIVGEIRSLVGKRKLSRID